MLSYDSPFDTLGISCMSDPIFFFHGCPNCWIRIPTGRSEYSIDECIWRTIIRCLWSTNNWWKRRAERPQFFGITERACRTLCWVAFAQADVDRYTPNILALTSGSMLTPCNSGIIDIWWLVWAIFIIATIERKNLLDNSKVWFDLFRVLFELVSAFGGIGLSLGFPSVCTRPLLGVHAIIIHSSPTFV